MIKKSNGQGVSRRVNSMRYREGQKAAGYLAVHVVLPPDLAEHVKSIAARDMLPKSVVVENMMRQSLEE